MNINKLLSAIDNFVPSADGEAISYEEKRIVSFLLELEIDLFRMIIDLSADGKIAFGDFKIETKIASETSSEANSSKGQIAPSNSSLASRLYARCDKKNSDYAEYSGENEITEIQNKTAAAVENITGKSLNNKSSYLFVEADKRRLSINIDNIILGEKENLEHKDEMPGLSILAFKKILQQRFLNGEMS
jgi:hypothetical protein